MNERDELEALRRLAELEAKAGNIPYQTPSQRRGENMGERLDKLPMSQGEVLAIGAGRQADRFAQGVKELGLSANVAAREAMGMPSGDQLRALAEQEQAQKFRDESYLPLKEKHPFLTGAGESAFLTGVPMGQASVLGRIAAPAGAAVVNELMSFGSPKERAMQAVEKGIPAAAGGVVGEGMRMLVTPAKSTLNAAQQQALERAAKTIGYKPRASELTGNETLRRFEDAVARQPGGAGPMRDLIDENRVLVNQHAAKGMGEKAERLTPDVFAAQEQRLSQTYNDLRAQTNMPVVQEIFDGVTRAETLLGKGDKTGPKKEAFDMIQRLKDELFQNKAFDGATYQAWTSDLAAKARELGKTNATAAAALREVEKSMDAIARGPNAPAWAKADKEFAVAEMLKRPRVVNEATGDVSPLHVASQMERQFRGNMKSGKVKGELADIANLGRALPPMREGSQTAGRQAFGSLPGWALAAPNYLAAKALTSEFGRDYLSRGLLGNPAVSSGVGGLLGRGAIPLSIAEIEALMLGYQ